MSNIFFLVTVNILSLFSYWNWTVISWYTYSCAIVSQCRGANLNRYSLSTGPYNTSTLHSSGYIEDIQWFDAFGIYFMSETGFFEFHKWEDWVKILKILSHQWNRFQIRCQKIEFSLNYIFFGFSTFFY